jgi:tetratricopeptide (TPR) repeat protein
MAAKSRARTAAKPAATPSDSVPPAVESVSAAPPVGEPKSADDAILLQDWTPLGQCLDFKIGQVYWARHAADLFADNKVPNLVHDSGAQSQRAARLLETWCRERQERGDLPDSIVVVELGMGTGLHLRYFLDAFQERATAAGADWYGRLDVYATDVAPETLRQASERKLFEPHAGKVHLGYMDATRPGLFRSFETGRSGDLRGAVHVLVANYVLDVLPVDIFRRQKGAGPGQEGTAEGHWWEGVLVRTWLRKAELLAAYTDATVDDLRKAARDLDEPSLVRLAEAWSLLHVELRAWPVDLAGHPDLPELHRVADAVETALGEGHELLRDGTIVNHSAGALRTVLMLGHVLADGGYACLRDVATVTPEMAAVPRSYQSYGPTLAAGVNLFQIDGFLATDKAPDGVRMVKPDHDSTGNQAARLLVRGELPKTCAEFAVAFDGQEMRRAGNLADDARAQAEPVQAMELYRQSLLLEPTNWYLMTEAARSALAECKRPDLAVAIAHKGLQLNPEYSPELWNVFGDAHFALGDIDAARRAYAFGLEVNPRHARLHYCMAVAEANRGRFTEAFAHIGQSLAHDTAGTYRQDVLQVLDACLRGASHKQELEDERLKSRYDR